MGYVTYYTISFEGNEKEIEEFKEDLLEVSKDDFYDEDSEPDEDLVDLLKYGCCEAKLYDLFDWISEVAPHHSDVLVILDGDGEEPDDLWQARWKGEEYEGQHACITPFTNPKLFTEEEINNKNN